MAHATRIPRGFPPGECTARLFPKRVLLRACLRIHDGYSHHRQHLLLKEIP